MNEFLQGRFARYSRGESFARRNPFEVGSFKDRNDGSTSQGEVVPEAVVVHAFFIKV